MRGRRAPDTGLLTDRQQAQALIAAIDRGGLPLNPARINHIARSLGLDVVPARENAACECPAILRGAKRPSDCKVFGTLCTPENPIGSCMVSSEGACAAYYTYGRHSAVGA